MPDSGSAAPIDAAWGFVVPWAREASGELVVPHNAARGVNYTCYDPTCHVAVRLRSGPQRRPHFYHRTPTAADSHGESALHRAAKEWMAAEITRGSSFWFNYACQTCRRHRKYRLPPDISRGAVEVGVGVYRADVAGYDVQDHLRVVIEILVAHQVGAAKAQDLAIPWVELRATEVIELPHGPFSPVAFGGGWQVPEECPRCRGLRSAHDSGQHVQHWERACRQCQIDRERSLREREQRRDQLRREARVLRDRARREALAARDQRIADAERHRATSHPGHGFDVQCPKCRTEARQFRKSHAEAALLGHERGEHRYQWIQSCDLCRQAFLTEEAWNASRPRYDGGDSDPRWWQATPEAHAWRADQRRQSNA